MPCRQILAAQLPNRPCLQLRIAQGAELSAFMERETLSTYCMRPSLRLADTLPTANQHRSGALIYRQSQPFISQAHRPARHADMLPTANQHRSGTLIYRQSQPFISQAHRPATSRRYASERKPTSLRRIDIPPIATFYLSGAPSCTSRRYASDRKPASLRHTIPHNGAGMGISKLAPCAIACALAGRLACPAVAHALWRGMPVRHIFPASLYTCALDFGQGAHYNDIMNRTCHKGAVLQ
jgi:hypothetical protein